MSIAPASCLFICKANYRTQSETFPTELYLKQCTLQLDDWSTDSWEAPGNLQLGASR
jgi:hypothetical protein